LIPPTFIHDLLSRVDIVEVVGRHVQLKKTGINLSGLCPFHAEKSPSFSVAPTKQFYHCFGCGANGDAIRFLTEFCSLSFVDAVRDLAQQVGMAVPDEDLSPTEREHAAAQKKRRSTLTDVLAQAAEGFCKQLKLNPRATNYLKSRGLSGEIAAQFGLGYAPEGWRNLASVFAHYDDPLLEESGMVIVKNADDDGNALPEAQHKRYDRFRDRIMFPIRAVQGDVIGFGGRVLDCGEPKYLNSPETLVFSKGRELYGLFEGRNAIRDRGHALVVEGYMDVVALAQAGLGNAVATLGTACTADHLNKLFRFTDSVVFSFDGDAAGRRAARRALETSLPHATDTRTVRFLFLPPEHDPDSFVRQNGVAAFEACIQRAAPLSRQLIEAAAQDCDLTTAEGRARMLANARPLWLSLPEGSLKDQLLNSLAEQGSDEASKLLQRWTAQTAQAAPTVLDANNPRQWQPRRTRSKPPSKSAATLLDRAIWLLLHRSELWVQMDENAHNFWAEQPVPYDMFFSCIERSLNEHGPIARSALLAELQQKAQQESVGKDVIQRIAAFHDPQPDNSSDAHFTHELGLIMDKLRLQAVEEELQLFFKSGDISPEAQIHGKELMKRQASLKAQLAKSSTAQSAEAR
jgi:DNA primase